MHRIKKEMHIYGTLDASLLAAVTNRRVDGKPSIAV
jgi:hypothetical protein